VQFLQCLIYTATHLSSPLSYEVYHRMGISIFRETITQKTS